MKALFIAMVAVGFASVAYAQETWKGGLALMPEKSMRTCNEQPQIEWTFTTTGNTFSGVSKTGSNFSTPIASDGSVRQTYRGSLGAQTFEVEISGNAKTRQLEIYNITFSCRWRVVPK